MVAPSNAPSLKGKSAWGHRFSMAWISPSTRKRPTSTPSICTQRPRSSGTRSAFATLWYANGVPSFGQPPRRTGSWEKLATPSRGQGVYLYLPLRNAMVSNDESNPGRSPDPDHLCGGGRLPRHGSTQRALQGMRRIWRTNQVRIGRGEQSGGCRTTSHLRRLFSNHPGHDRYRRVHPHSPAVRPL